MSAHPVGTTVWIDFGSNDFATSTTFYRELFGWEFTDSGPDTNHYTMITNDGALVGGAMDTSRMTCPEGGPIPSSWDVYLAVDDVDARAEKATAAGATVIVPPGDAGAAGRFAVVVDPTGATIGMWQAGDTTGYEFTGKPGSPVWFEVMSQDIEATKAFYSEVFDFDPTPMGEPMDEDAERGAFVYYTNGPQEQASSGMCDASGFVPAEVGSFWRVYLAVESCDPAVRRVEELGGKLLDGPDDSPFGRIATVADPQGATFQIAAPSEAVPEGSGG